LVVAVLAAYYWTRRAEVAQPHYAQPLDDNGMSTTVGSDSSPQPFRGKPIGRVG